MYWNHDPNLYDASITKEPTMHFALFFAHLDTTPTKDAEKLPEFATHEAVSVVRCTAKDAAAARKKLVKLAEASENFTEEDHMSMLVEEMSLAERTKTLKKVLAGLVDDDCWTVILGAMPTADLQTDNSGQYVIYTGCYDPDAEDTTEYPEGEDGENT